ncbi:ABC transporter substrate-binding protein [Streptomyces sp. NBC_01474]|uniref:ABC transporter substrate-binding protein n=1 Tax=Streptomyces sp. NBC_01474 TaxID=2903880 RepID=UPI002DDAED52|nr:ABC transporter substrate-binding protein [Streptomyces sp. NBC_01474]WSD94880.1 ABC transporter substrate-binding protein [Streptomyces sp. NBC_01474]
MARLIRHGRRPIAVLAMSSAMALVLSACGTHPSAGSPSGSADSYKVGFILQLSGAGSVYADHAQAGSKAGFEDVNKHNKAGVRFTSMVADAGADARSANTACSRLIQQQKAQAIVAFIPGPQLLACNALAKRLDIPLVSLSSGAGNICAWNLTSLGLVPNQQTLPAIDELVAEGKKRWYFLGANYSTPKASIGTAKEHLTKLGGTVVGTAYEPSGTADFSQDIANIVKARPDVAFLNVIGDDDVALQKQWAADPRTKGITRVDVLLGEGTAKALGAAAEGIWSSSIYFAAIKGSGNDAFKDLAERSGLKGAPDVNAYVSYMQVQALAAAVKQSGADGRDVVKALRHTDIDGPVGALKSMNSFSYQPVYLAQARSDGTFTIRKKSDPIPPKLACQG